jgi:predicted glycoside hydrolase/deacetylase ChbG (UPF0249 family)
MTAKMIINADDFGLCEGVNKAIAEAHCGGVLTSATIMANMPGSDEAVAMAKKMPSLGVGVHLNVLEGKPVSTDSKVDVLLGEDGKFKYSPSKLAIKTFISEKIRKAVEIELTAQVESVIKRGVKPTHLDSHKHFHCFGPIYKIVCSLAENFKIGAIRWPWEPETVCCGNWPQVGMKDKIRAFMVRQMAVNCQKIDSRFIKNDIFFGLAHTGRIDKEFWAEIGKTQFGGTAEVMTHPGYPEGLVNTRLVEQRQVELKWLCESATKQILSEAGIELVHYGKI